MCFQLPRAVNTQALSGAGILKMINKASDAVNKMTIKMNESDSVRSICMKCFVMLTVVWSAYENPFIIAEIQVLI